MAGKDILKALSPIANLSGDNAGFALGLLPGLMYKDYKKSKAEEEAEKGMPAGAAPGMKKGGSVGSASKRADGIAQRGKTRGKMY